MGIRATSSGSTGFLAARTNLSPESALTSDPAPVVPRPLATLPLPELKEKAKEKAKEKDPTIETLRGLAIVFIVIGHVIGDVPNSGMAVEASSMFRLWHGTTRYLRSPLFFVISGYLYAHRPVEAGRFAEFARGKARLLVLPFLSIATLQFLLKIITPGVHGPTRLEDIWRIYVFGFDQFWFSQAAICTFATVLLLEKILPIPQPYRWSVYMLLAILFEIAVPKPAIFSFYLFSAMLPLFFLGCVLYRPPVSCPGPRITLARACGGTERCAHLHRENQLLLSAVPVPLGEPAPRRAGWVRLYHLPVPCIRYRWVADRAGSARNP
jgi:hypothetical protein